MNSDAIGKRGIVRDTFLDLSRNVRGGCGPREDLKPIIFSIWTGLVDKKLTTKICNALSSEVAAYSAMIKSRRITKRASKKRKRELKALCAKQDRLFMERINAILFTYAQLVQLEKYRYFQYLKKVDENTWEDVLEVQNSFSYGNELYQVHRRLVDSIERGQMGKPVLHLNLDLLAIYGDDSDYDEWYPYVYASFFRRFANDGQRFETYKSIALDFARKRASRHQRVRENEIYQLGVNEATRR
jgi:hypothetical protein